MTLQDDDGNTIEFEGEFALTKQSFSPLTLKIKGDVSVNFKIPNNSYNRKILGYFSPLQVDAPQSISKVFNLVSETGQTLARGTLVIQKDDETFLECFFLSSNSNWINQLQNKFNEYAFEDYVVLYDSINTQKSATEGIIFPLVDWFSDGKKCVNVFQYSSAWHVDEQQQLEIGLQEYFPCVYMHTLLKEVSKNTGFKFDGNVISDNRFKSIIITPKGPDLKYPQNVILDTFVYSGLSASWGVTSSLTTIPFDVLIDYGKKTQYSTTNYKWTSPRKCTLKVSFNLTIDDITKSVRNYWYVNGSNYSNDTAFGWGSSWGASADYHLIRSTYINVNAGDTVELKMQTLAGSCNLSQSSTMRIEIQDAIYNPIFRGSRLGALGGTPHSNQVPYVFPPMIIGDMKVIDLIKFICCYFQAIITFDDFTRTISINSLSRISDIEDWSDYFVSSYADYNNNVATNNYIKLADAQEVDLINYNHVNDVDFGGGNIQTDFQQLDQNTIYKSPFAAANDKKQSLIDLLIPYINFYNPTSGDKVSYTSVTNSGGYALFQFSGAGQSTIAPGDLVYVESESNTYVGYGIAQSNLFSPNQFAISGLPFIVTTTGTITKVSWSSVSGGNRLLSVLPDRNVSDISVSLSSIVYSSTDTVLTSSSTQAIAWFDKPRIGVPADVYNTSLSISKTKGKEYNISISDVHWDRTKVIFNSVPIRGKFVLPTDTFVNYKHDKLITVKSKRITGNFYVETILNYVDCKTEVECLMHSV